MDKLKLKLKFGLVIVACAFGVCCCSNRVFAMESENKDVVDLVNKNDNVDKKEEVVKTQNDNKISDKMKDSKKDAVTHEINDDFDYFKFEAKDGDKVEDICNVKIRDDGFATLEFYKQPSEEIKHEGIESFTPSQVLKALEISEKFLVEFVEKYFKEDNWTSSGPLYLKECGLNVTNPSVLKRNDIVDDDNEKNFIDFHLFIPKTGSVFSDLKEAYCKIEGVDNGKFKIGLKENFKFKIRPIEDLSKYDSCFFQVLNLIKKECEKNGIPGMLLDLVYARMCVFGNFVSLLMDKFEKFAWIRFDMRSVKENSEENYYFNHVENKELCNVPFFYYGSKFVYPNTFSYISFYKDEQGKEKLAGF